MGERNGHGEPERLDRVLRRIQVTGGSTYIVSLPKEWVRRNKLDRGDYVELVLEFDGSLKIRPARRRTEKPETSMTVSKDEPPEWVLREFISRYLAGYYTIRVFFEDSVAPYRRLFRVTIPDKLIGVEVVDESTKHLVAQCLVNVHELSLSTAIQRAYRIVYTMIYDALKVIAGELGPEMLDDIVERDDLVDKFYLYSVRQLNELLAGLLSPGEIGLARLSDSLTYRIMVKNLERIGDHARRIAKSLKMLKSPVLEQSLAKMVDRLGRVVLRLLEDSYRSFREGNTELAHKVIDKVGQEVPQLESRALSLILDRNYTSRQITLLKTVVESLKRVAEYSADIAELAIDMSVYINEES